MVNNWPHDEEFKYQAFQDGSRVLIERLDGLPIPGAVLVRTDETEAVEQIVTVSTACVGDVDRNGVVDGRDVAVMQASVGRPDPAMDLDGNGRVDGRDLRMVLDSQATCGGGPSCSEPGSPCATDADCCSGFCGGGRPSARVCR